MKFCFQLLIFFFVTPFFINSQNDTITNIVIEIEGRSEVDSMYKTQTVNLVQELISPENINSTWPAESLVRYNCIIEKAYDWSMTQKTNSSLKSQLDLQIFYYHYWVTHNYPLAVKMGELLLKKQALINAEDKRQVCIYLKHIYMRIGHMNKYIEMIEIEKSLVKQLNKVEDFKEYDDLARAYLKMKNYEKSIYFFHKQLNDLDQDNYFSRSSTLNNMGFTFFKAKQYDSAYYYYDKAIETLKLYQPDESGKAYAKHFNNVLEANKTEIDVIKGNYKNAIAVYKKEIESANAVGEYHISSSGKKNLACVYFLLKNYDLALETLESAEADISKIYDTEAQIQNLNIKGKIYLAKGLQKKADSLFKIEEHLVDSIAKQKTKKLTEVVAVLYETNVKDNILREQKLQINEQKNELLNAKHWRWLLLSILVSTIVLLVATYIFYKNNKAQKKKIESQKLIVDNSLRQKEILLQEIHHRIKNNLQIISSLLARQGEKTNNDIVKEIMENSQSRIQSIALVHQKLYQLEDFKSIDFCNYATEIVVKIEQTFKVKDQNISYHINIPAIKFDIDTVIPLGLIVNELITNCYKYAFVNRQYGNIWLTFQKIESNTYELCVIDDGVGLKDGVNKTIENSTGISMVKGLAWQLKGTLNYNSNDSKTTFKITFTVN